MKSKNPILKDLIENIKNHTELIKNVGKRYYQYDRGDFIKSLNGTHWDKERYLSDIETLSTEIIQMILFNRIIYLDDGIDIRTDKVIVEKETLPLMKQKELEWERNSKELRQLISKVQKRIKKEKEQNDIINK